MRKSPPQPAPEKPKEFENSYNDVLRLHSVMKLCKVKNLDKETFDKWFDLKEYLKNQETEFYKKQELVMDGYGIKPDPTTGRFIGFEDHAEREEIMKKLATIQFNKSFNFVKKNLSIFSDRSQLYEKIVSVSPELDSDQTDLMIKFLIKK